jgi:hypothetical protein
MSEMIESSRNEFDLAKNEPKKIIYSAKSN